MEIEVEQLAGLDLHDDEDPEPAAAADLRWPRQRVEHTWGNRAQEQSTARSGKATTVAILDIYSKRGKPTPDVYEYVLPAPLRVQILRIVDSALASPLRNIKSKPLLYGLLHTALAHEYGLLQLAQGNSDAQRIQTFILTDDSDRVLDLIEHVLRLVVDPKVRFYRLSDPSEAIDELNSRFRQHGVGYQIEGRDKDVMVVKVDSTYAHPEIVKPALTVLRAPHFKGAEAEFQKAHEHYRHQRHEEAINECLKALESTLKVICGRRGWQFDESDTASKLIAHVFSNGLVPGYLEGQFGGLRGVLEAGVPTIRNRSGGHGAGATPRDVPEHLVAYVLHLTAAAILFLAESEAT